MGVEPDLFALRALLWVAASGSLNTAAKKLGVSQQAISVRLRKLEKSLQVALLDRSPRGSVLTSDGEIVCTWAQNLLDSVESFTNAVGSLQAEHGDQLRVAASLTIAEHLLPNWLTRWRCGWGNDELKVHFIAANTRDVITEVKSGRVDLGFIESFNVPPNFGSRTVGQDEILVVAPPSHPWSKAGKISLTEVSRTALVLRESGSGTRQAFEDALGKAGFHLTIPPAAVLTTTLGLRNTIAVGNSPGVLSSLAVQEDLAKGRLVQVDITGFQILRPLTAIWQGERPTKLARDLLNQILT